MKKRIAILSLVASSLFGQVAGDIQLNQFNGTTFDKLIATPTGTGGLVFSDNPVLNGTIALNGSIFMPLLTPNRGAGIKSNGQVVSLSEIVHNDTGLVTSITCNGPIVLDGIADQIQFRVQGAAGQSAELAVMENSAGTDLFKVGGSGNVCSIDGSASSPALSFISDTDTGIYRPASDTLSIATGGSQRAAFGLSSGAGSLTLYTSSGNAIYNASGGANIAQLGSATVGASLCSYWNINASTGIFSSTNRAYAFSLGGDCTLVGDAANVLAQRNGTNAQAVRYYNTYTSSTNYERGKLEWASNVWNIGTEKGSGGGTARGLAFQTDGTDRITISSTGGIALGGGTAIKSVKSTTATLVAGTVTVADTDTTANTHVVATVITPGGTQGYLDFDVSAGASYTVNSSSALETSTVTITAIHYQ